MSGVDYSYLSARDRLLIAQARLRSLEREHFGLSLSDPYSPEGENARVRMSQIEPKMEEIRALVESLEAEQA